MELSVGCLVLSRQGRDKGRYFLVTQLCETSATVADGRTHRLEKPKKKNPKHLSWQGPGEPALTEKLLAGETVSDTELRRALQQFCPDAQP